MDDFQYQFDLQPYLPDVFFEPMMFESDIDEHLSCDPSIFVVPSFPVDNMGIRSTPLSPFSESSDSLGVSSLYTSEIDQSLVSLSPLSSFEGLRAHSPNIQNSLETHDERGDILPMETLRLVSEWCGVMSDYYPFQSQDVASGTPEVVIANSPPPDPIQGAIAQSPLVTSADPPPPHALPSVDVVGRRKKNKPKFSCSKCSKDIYSKNRRQHMETHNPNRRMFRCEDSSCVVHRGFTRRDDLGRHIRMEHGGHLPAVDHPNGNLKAPPSRCEACRKTGFGKGGCKCGYVILPRK